MDPDVRGTCLALVEILEGIQLGDGGHLSYQFFHERLPNNVRPELLIPSLSLLCSSEDAPLEMHAYLLDAEEGQLHLNDEEFAVLLNEEILAHPVTGDLVEEPFEWVRIYYALKDQDGR
ncbi:hypothetical protein [Mameliella alba]|uniref:hypothetical protein n=1 Tax=Mameliella alba TaxID=561184 RepID=UPI001ADC4BCB|nr:hypothetical protein [Mameliella alba]